MIYFFKLKKQKFTFTNIVREKIIGTSLLYLTLLGCLDFYQDDTSKRAKNMAFVWKNVEKIGNIKIGKLFYKLVLCRPALLSFQVPVIHKDFDQNV